MEQGILKDILYIGKEFKNGLTNAVFNNSNIKRQSLARGAKKGTLQFPVIVSKSLSLQDINMLSKALERQYVSFVQIVTSLNSTTTEKDVDRYLRSMHQNYEIEDEEISLRLGNGIAKLGESMAHINSFDNMHAFNQSLVESNDNIVSVDVMSLEYNKRTHFLNTVSRLCEGYEIHRTPKGVFAKKGAFAKEIFLVESLETEECQILETMELPMDFTYSKTSVNVRESLGKAALLSESKGALFPFVEATLNDLSNASKVVSITDTKGGVINANRYNNVARLLSEANVNKPAASKLTDNGKKEKMNSVSTLSNTDVKKANELVPTMMELTTHFVDSEGKVNRTEKYIIGIKTIIHSVSSESMVDNLVRGVKSDRMFHKLLKYTTGEISFFKDFLFGINELKSEIQSKHGESMWWGTLKKRQRASSVLNRIGFQGLLPNAAIIVTKDEADIIKQTNKIDFEELDTAQALMKAYHMLGFVIVDASVETVKFMFDGDKGFREYSYAALERENTNSSKEIKNIMQVLGRM